MDSDSIDVRGLLREYGLRPDKRLGQNFLISGADLKKVVRCAEIRDGEAVLEIGPGLGSLTRHLAKASPRVVAVELDGDLLPPLRDVTRDLPQVEVVHADILACDISTLMAASRGYVVVANIPYYITSAVIRHLLTANAKPRSLTLTMQAEVAERICAEPGNHSLLSLSVQVFGKPAIRGRIPAGSFYPAPKVDSAIVHVELFSEPPMTDAQLETFFSLLKAGFSQKRKNLRNSLSGGLGAEKDRVEAVLAQAGIDPSRRAQSLAMDEWQRLVEVYVSDRQE